MSPLEHAVGCLNGWDLVRAVRDGQDVTETIRSVHLGHGWLGRGIGAWCSGETRGFVVREIDGDGWTAGVTVTWAALGAAVERALTDDDRAELATNGCDGRAVAQRVKDRVRGGTEPMQLDLFAGAR